ncbi:MAG: class II aldolase/adducin family protein [Xanthomonadales bacterium]|nr:class II aldolase/adducin family protein [Xanthomonadales bacterium]
MTDERRQQLIDTACAMNRSGINRGTAGNLSLRCGNGLLITPSGRSYKELEPRDIVFIGPDGRFKGHGKPSSEWRIHYDIYRGRSDAAAILHAHPTHCTALACMRQPIPPFHYMVAVAGGSDIPCASYATFGTQALSDNVLQALEGRKACLMANHGLLCLAKDLPGALALAVEIEQLAFAYMECLAVGPPVLLDDAEMDRVLERFKDYGAN